MFKIKYEKYEISSKANDLMNKKKTLMEMFYKLYINNVQKRAVLAPKIGSLSYYLRNSYLAYYILLVETVVSFSPNGRGD